MENLNLIDFVHNAANIWLAVGIVLVLVDVIHLGGLGLMFAGFGAVVAGIAIHTGMIAADATVKQFIVFFAFTAVWAVILWKPLKKFRLHKHSDTYSNIVGETAYVGSNGLDRRSGGEVTWSGTIMKGELAKGVSVDKLEAGSQVTITGVTGATLIVKPKE